MEAFPFQNQHKAFDYSAPWVFAKTVMVAEWGEAPSLQNSVLLVLIRVALLPTSLTRQGLPQVAISLGEIPGSFYEAKKLSFHISHTPSQQGLRPRVFLILAATGEARCMCCPVQLSQVHHIAASTSHGAVQLPPQTLKTLFKIRSSKLQQGQPGVKTLRLDCQSSAIHTSK